jgi:hypothetical protein
VSWFWVAGILTWLLERTVALRGASGVWCVGPTPTSRIRLENRPGCYSTTQLLCCLHAIISELVLRQHETQFVRYLNGEKFIGIRCHVTCAAPFLAMTFAACCDCKGTISNSRTNYSITDRMMTVKQHSCPWCTAACRGTIMGRWALCENFRACFWKEILYCWPRYSSTLWKCNPVTSLPAANESRSAVIATHLRFLSELKK